MAQTAVLLHVYYTCLILSTLSLLHIPSTSGLASPSQLPSSMMSGTMDADAPLLSILQTAFPTISSYEIMGNVVQASAEGFRVTVQHDNADTADTTDNADNADNDNSELRPQQLFVKRVRASSYAKKPWPDLRRTLLYIRTEARFYTEFLPLLSTTTAAVATPTCHSADCRFDGLISDDEPAADAPRTVPPPYAPGATSSLDGRGGFLVLRSLPPSLYHQTSPVSLSRAARCLRAVARLHAAAFHDVPLLRAASARLFRHGGSYHLANRNPDELGGMEESWDAFVRAFRPVAPEGFFDDPSLEGFGGRMGRAARWVSEELSPGPDREYATIVHGDYKAMNVFLPTEEEEGEEAVMIDFAACGVGFGMVDVAMHVWHAVGPEDLGDGGEVGLVEGYLDALEEALGGEGGDGGERYPREVAMRHYRLASVDYLRFVLGRFWRSASVEGFEKRKDGENTTLINRNVGAALNCVKRVAVYLKEIEEEVEAKGECLENGE